VSSQRLRLNGLVSDALYRAEKLDDAQSWREAADAYAHVAGIEAAIAFCEECPPDERLIGVLGHRVAMQLAEECEAHFRETPCEDAECGFALCDRCNNAWRRQHSMAPMTSPRRRAPFRTLPPTYPPKEPQS